MIQRRRCTGICRSALPPTQYATYACIDVCKFQYRMIFSRASLHILVRGGAAGHDGGQQPMRDCAGLHLKGLERRVHAGLDVHGGLEQPWTLEARMGQSQDDQPSHGLPPSSSLRRERQESCGTTRCRHQSQMRGIGRQGLQEPIFLPLLEAYRSRQGGHQPQIKS